MLLFCTADQPLIQMNMALNKATSQRQTYATARAEYGVDGNNNGEYLDNSCTHSIWDTETWWQVDLGSNYRIHSVVIYNRNLFGNCVWII